MIALHQNVANCQNTLTVLTLRWRIFPQGGIAPNQVIARSEFEVHRECNEGRDWCIYVTVVTCADTLTSTLCIQ